MEKYTKSQIINIIKSSKNKKECLIKLKVGSNSYDTLNRYIKKYNIDISHFEQTKLIKPKKDISILLTKNSQYSISNIKKRLFDEGLKKEICEKCGQNNIWNGEKISLILDHKNGINNDNRLENLRILCPNCNATLDTHCGGNKKHIDVNITKEDIFKYIKECSSIRQIILKLGIYKSSNTYKKIQKIITDNNWWELMKEKQDKIPKLNKNQYKLEKINKILEANIDFSKKTWGVEVSKLLNCSPQYALKFVKKNIF